MRCTRYSAFEAVKSAVSAQQAAQAYGLEPNRKGFCRCPFHSEKTASMKVYSDSRGFYCFGCQTGGDVIKLVQRLFRLKPIDAAKKLDADFAVGAFDDAGNAQKADLTILKAAAMRQRQEFQNQVLLDNISLEKRYLNLNFFNKKPATPEQAQVQAARLAYFEWLEYVENEELKGRCTNIFL